MPLPHKKHHKTFKLMNYKSDRNETDIKVQNPTTHCNLYKN
jgi:hypothetical protein